MKKSEPREPLLEERAGWILIATISEEKARHARMQIKRIDDELEMQGKMR